MEQKRFAVLGGDKRSIYLSKLIEADGHAVSRFGFDSYDEEIMIEKPNLYEAIDGAAYVLCPIPCSHNGTELNTAYSSQVILMEDIFRLMKPWQMFMAGYIKGQVLDLARKYDIVCTDLLKQEELAIMNAIPTAEGAIKIAIEKTDFTIHNSRAMVLGLGRIGKILSKMLSGMGAHVYAVVRSRHDAALAKSYGYTAVMLDDMPKSLKKMNLIFNTVPHILLDKKNMKYIDKDCLILDLASAPYGVNFSDGKAAGLKILYVGSLPGIVAPCSTAMYMKDSIYNLIG